MLRIFSAAIVFLTVCATAFPALIGLTPFCLSNGASASYQTALGFLTLTGNGREARVFLLMPYVVQGGEVHYLARIPSIGTNGEVLLPEETAALLKTLLSPGSSASSAGSSRAISSAGSSAAVRQGDVFIDPDLLLRSEKSSHPATNVITVRASSSSRAAVSSAFRSSSPAVAVRSGSARSASPAVEVDDFRPIEAVVIDPGHGGNDPGGMTTYGNPEKEIVLDVSKKLYAELSQRGVKTLIMTRKSDIFVTLADRAKITADAAKKKNVIFVSVHANASPIHATRGFEVYSLADRASDEEAQSVEFAENAQFSSADVKKAATVLDILSDLFKDEVRRESDVLSRMTAESFVPETGCELRGVKKANFYVLRYSPVPSVLVEIGFMSNPAEGKKLMDRKYRAAMARGIAGGIVRYIQEYDKTRGFTR